MSRRLLIAALTILVSAGSVSTQAKKLTVYSRVDAGPWGVRGQVYTRPGRPVRLKVRPVPGATARWFQIVPNVDKRYNNAGWPWDPNAYRWLGWAKIEYRVTELRALRGQWTVMVYDGRRAITTWPYAQGPRYFHRDKGSYWFQVIIVRGERVVARSAGIEDNGPRGLSPRVLRLTVRRGPGLLGFVAGFFNVPALFGATPYQSRNLIGVDCAEVVMAAYAQMKRRRLWRDYNVQMLTRYVPRVAAFNLDQGRPDKDLRWGREVRPGDLIAVRYRGAKFFQHIGVLGGDHNRNGRLDAADRVLHVGPDPLAVSPLSDGAFDGHALILRLR